VIWVLIGTVIVIITVPAMAPSHHDAKWLFTEFLNETGYSNSGLVFLLGLLQAGWTLTGYEAGAQIVEGTKRADITAPRGIIVSVLGAAIQGFLLIISALFSIQDVDELINADLTVTVFLQRAVGNSLAAFFLVILLVAQFGSLCNSILATGHLFWAMARDNCIPYASFWYKLSDKGRIPFRALLLQLFVSIVVIMPIFGTEVYWEAIMSTAVICINVSYGLPLLCRLVWVRRDMPKGPFSLGKAGIVLNIISVCWITFFMVILCIPSSFPVLPETMNWSCLMIGVVFLFAQGFWLASGRKGFKGPMQNIDED
ncbi:amino acid/polyamine transporter I, partial [Syncephalastrum racemosum]